MRHSCITFTSLPYINRDFSNASSTLHIHQPDSKRKYGTNFRHPFHNRRRVLQPRNFMPFDSLLGSETFQNEERAHGLRTTPNRFRGAVTLSSTTAIQLFFDADLAETRDLMARLSIGPLPALTTSSSAITKLETVTIHELLQFIQTETPQIASFYCFATIVDVHGQYGWNYISCTTCKTKLGKTETSMYCTYCKKKTTTSVSSDTVSRLLSVMKTKTSQLLLSLTMMVSNLLVDTLPSFWMSPTVSVIEPTLLSLPVYKASSAAPASSRFN